MDTFKPSPQAFSFHIPLLRTRAVEYPTFLRCHKSPSKRRERRHGKRQVQSRAWVTMMSQSDGLVAHCEGDTKKTSEVAVDLWFYDTIVVTLLCFWLFVLLWFVLSGSHDITHTHASAAFGAQCLIDLTLFCNKFSSTSTPFQTHFIAPCFVSNRINYSSRYPLATTVSLLLLRPSLIKHRSCWPHTF